MMSPVLATIANELHQVLPALVEVLKPTAPGNPFKGWPEEKTRLLRKSTYHLLDLSLQKAFVKVQSIKDIDERRFAAYRVWSTWVLGRRFQRRMRRRPVNNRAPRRRSAAQESCVSGIAR